MLTPSIEPEEDGGLSFYFHDERGAIVACGHLLTDGTAVAWVYDGTKIVARERMTADEMEADRQMQASAS